MVYFICKRGRKYLNISPDMGVFWGTVRAAFRFNTEAAAIQVGCALIGPTEAITVLRKEE